jgi:hypothetical protein
MIHIPAYIISRMTALYRTAAHILAYIMTSMMAFYMSHIRAYIMTRMIAVYTDDVQNLPLKQCLMLLAVPHLPSTQPMQ